MEGLSVVCAGLGVIEEDEDGNCIGYTKDEYCLDNLKDLLRFLRRDDPQTREVFKQVCKWNTVGKDLIPIIEYCQDDHNLVLNAVKVLVFLTMPLELTSSDIPQQIEYLWGLKYSITCSNAVPIIISLLYGPLENLTCEAFADDDWKLVQLVLTLFRNILAIQDISAHQRAGGSSTLYVSLRDKFLEMLFQDNVMDSILILSQFIGVSGYLRQDNLLLLETFHYIFLGQDPELIGQAYLERSKVDGDVDYNSLKSIMKEEQEKRKLKRVQYLRCYSQLTGTFTRLAMDGSKTLLKGNPGLDSHDSFLKSHKNHRGPKKRAVWDHERLPQTKNNILQMLHDFVNQFLLGGYNVLMQSVQEDIEKEHHAVQNNDIVVFFHVIGFVTSFQYHKILASKPNIDTDQSAALASHNADNTTFEGSICGPLSSSMNESMFVLVISKWRYAFDCLKELHNYKFLSAAGSLMKIMIRMLDLVLKLSPESSKESQTARILLYKLFYDQTDQGMTHFFLNLIKSFNSHKQKKSDLADLVETLHVIIRLMENLQARGTLRVSKKGRRKRKRRTSIDKKDNDDKIVDSILLKKKIVDSRIQNEMEVLVTDKSVSLNVNKDIEDVIAGDVASNAIDDFAEQSPLLRLSEKGTSQDQNPDGKGEDFVIPSNSDEPETSKLETSNSDKNMSELENKQTNDRNDDFYDESSSGDEQLAVTDEVDFKLSALVSALANSTIIQNICWLLKFYKSNSNKTNHYIICMLKRICDDLVLSPILYQLSLLMIFYDILGDQKLNSCNEHEKIVEFLTSLVRRMLRRMKQYPLLFVEILFWKTRQECHYISCGSMLDDIKKLRTETRNHETFSGDAENCPIEGKGWIRRSIADALGDDEADFVVSHVHDDEKKEDHYEVNSHKVSKNGNGSYRGANGIAGSILEDGIDGKDSSGNEAHLADHACGVSNERGKLLIFHDELERKLKSLYEDYKDSQDCSRLIAESLMPRGKVSAAQVSKKLKQLGFKVLRKKKASHPKQLGKESGSMEDTVYPKSKDVEENSSLQKPLRRRIRAFNEDQERMIKTLFEQFKDHKRCSYMIANALNSDGTFSVAQVSRKLRQLGLHVPKKQRSDSKLNLKDEDLVDISTKMFDDSDLETLSSLRKRKNQSAILRKKDEDRSASNKETASEEHFDSQIVIEREGEQPPIAEESKSTGTEDGELSIIGDVNHLLKHDEMEGIEDDMSRVLSQNTVKSRRKLRMVIDFEDDD